MVAKVMDEHIWTDFYSTVKKVLVYSLCCSKYANIMRKRKRTIDWVVIIIPAIGAAFYPLSPYCTLGASILTTLFGILEKLLPHTVQPESELIKLDNLQTSFEKILVEYEDAVHSFRLDKNTNDIQIKEFLKEKKTQVAELQTEMDKLVRKCPNSKQLNEDAEIYLKSKFNTTYN